MKLTKQVIFCFFLIFSFFSFVSSKVIITHGAFGKDSSWYLPGGYFYEAVNEDAKRLQREVVSFSWDQDLGGITHFERIRAGQELAKMILDFVNNGEKEITLIGYSYGGHVIKIASQILAYASYTSSALGTVTANKLTPKEELSVSLNDISSIQNDGTKSFAMANLEDEALFQQACDEIAVYMSKLGNKKSVNKEFLIDEVYTLGTPNDIPDYKADMKVIGHLYNFYSKGDLIQDIIGHILLPEPRHPRSVNICVEMRGSGWFGLWGYPNHLQMHAQTIGKWILEIPFELSKNNIGNFDKFSFENDGKIIFTPGREPLYQSFKAEENGIFGTFNLATILDKVKILKNIC